VVDTVPVPVTVGDGEPDGDDDGEPERVGECVADGEMLVCGAEEGERTGE
jgi:hypothetical protein